MENQKAEWAGTSLVQSLRELRKRIFPNVGTRQSIELIEDRATGEVVGVVYLTYRGPSTDLSVELGYILRPSAWGQGVASEAVQAIVETVRANFGVTRFRALVTESNSASQKVLEKSGFQYRYVKPDAYGFLPIRDEKVRLYTLHPDPPKK